MCNAHTLSHQWPTPTQAVIINPDTGLVTGGRSEVERRSQYFERIDRNRSDVLIPLIKTCLGNLPKNRPSIVRVCDQLEGQLVDREFESVSANVLTVPALQQEIQKKVAQMQRKDVEIQMYYNEIQRNKAEIQRLTTALHDKDVTLETLILVQSFYGLTSNKLQHKLFLKFQVQKNVLYNILKVLRNTLGGSVKIPTHW